MNEVQDSAVDTSTQQEPQAEPQLCKCGKKIDEPGRTNCAECRQKHTEAMRLSRQRARAASGEDKVNHHALSLMLCYAYALFVSYIGSDPGVSEDEFLWWFEEVEAFDKEAGFENFNGRFTVGKEHWRWPCSKEAMMGTCRDLLKKLGEPSLAEWEEAGGWDGFWNLIDHFPGMGKRLARECREGTSRPCFADPAETARWKKYVESVR